MKALAIVGLCVLASVVYGILHDQVTARVCVEYFTIGHPPVFGTEDPTLLGIGWGVIATWWVGLGLGVLLAAAARLGGPPKHTAAALVRPVCCLLVFNGVLALLAGLLGYTLARFGLVHLVGRIAREVPADRHVYFLADLWAHSSSYLFGAVGGLVVIVQTWRSRRRISP